MFVNSFLGVCGTCLTVSLYVLFELVLVSGEEKRPWKLRLRRTITRIVAPLLKWGYGMCLGRECKGVWEATCQRKRCDTRMLPLPLDGLLPNRLFLPLPFPITLLYLPSLINAPSHLHLSHLSYYIDLETSLASHRPTIEASLRNFSN